MLPLRMAAIRAGEGWWRPGYVVDYLAVVVLYLLVFLGLSQVHPFVRPFSPADPTLGHPALPDIVPASTALVVAFVVPASLALGVAGLRLAIQGRAPPAWRPVAPMASRSYARFVLHDAHHFLLGLLVTMALCMFITDSLKVGGNVRVSPLVHPLVLSL